MIVPWYLEEPRTEEVVGPDEAADPVEAVPPEARIA
jgi:hypothetical protein